MWSLFVMDQLRMSCSAWMPCLTEESILLALPAKDSDYQSSTLPAQPVDNYCPWRHLGGYRRHDPFAIGNFSWICRAASVLGRVIRKIFRHGGTVSGIDAGRPVITTAEIMSFDATYVPRLLLRFA
jgi:hypothetical protein